MSVVNKIEIIQLTVNKLINMLLMDIPAFVIFIEYFVTEWASFWFIYFSFIVFSIEDGNWNYDGCHNNNDNSNSNR